jgi:hypothetical protein
VSRRSPTPAGPSPTVRPSNFKALTGILIQSVGPSLAIWANLVQFSFRRPAADLRADHEGGGALPGPLLTGGGRAGRRLPPRLGSPEPIV